MRWPAWATWTNRKFSWPQFPHASFEGPARSDALVAPDSVFLHMCGREKGRTESMTGTSLSAVPCDVS